MNHTKVSRILNGASLSADYGVPLHGQVRDFLRGVIEEHFEDGQSFWTERLLVEELGVSRHTIRQALDSLTREGWLVREVPRGSFVRKTAVTSVGVVFEQANSDFVSEMIHQIALQCMDRELSLELYPLFAGPQLVELAGKIRRPPVEERILTMIGAESDRAKVHDDLTSRGYRVVSLQDTDPLSEVPSVTTDSRKAVAVAVEHLASLGHKRITFIVNEPSDRLSVRAKMDECRRHFRVLGLTEGRVVDCDPTVEGAFNKAYEIMPSLWRGNERPSAIFTASDPGAWAALRWFAENDIKIPRDVSVLGFEGVKPDAFTHPPLSSVAHPIRDLARLALDELWKPTGSHLKVEPQLILRRSTGPVPV